MIAVLYDHASIAARREMERLRAIAAARENTRDDRRAAAQRWGKAVDRLARGEAVGSFGSAGGPRRLSSDRIAARSRRRRSTPSPRARAARAPSSPRCARPRSSAGSVVRFRTAFPEAGAGREGGLREGLRGTNGARARPEGHSHESCSRDARSRPHGRGEGVDEDAGTNGQPPPPPATAATAMRPAAACAARRAAWM